MVDITGIACAALTLLFAIIAIYLIPYIRSKYSKDQLEKACDWAKIAVNAAEQLAKSGKIDPDERKDYAMNLLKEKNIKLDVYELDDIVESFVRELPNFILADDEDSEEVDG